MIDDGHVYGLCARVNDGRAVRDVLLAERVRAKEEIGRV